ncbi:MAG TPA: hypothetical protein VK306_03685 [Acidimicrobiales bacterium]|nr:hypothetical protein [Acidimicrobiales bacterium]
MRASRSTSLLVLPGGLAVGHAFGYFVAGLWYGAPSGEAIGHDYLGVLLRVAVPSLFTLVLRAFGRGARQGRPDGPRWATLAPQLVVAYVTVELIEHAQVGVEWTHALREPSLLWGVVGQLLVAAGAVLLLQAAHTAGGLFARAPRPRTRCLASPPRRAAAVDHVLGDVPARWASRRGPPTLSVAA